MKAAKAIKAAARAQARKSNDPSKRLSNWYKVAAEAKSRATKELTYYVEKSIKPDETFKARLEETLQRRIANRNERIDQYRWRTAPQNLMITGP